MVNEFKIYENENEENVHTHKNNNVNVDNDDVKIDNNSVIDKKEINYRKYISDKYKQGIWLQTLFVLNYWVNDNSENFEMTDAAIEKAVNLSFKLFGDTVLDNVIDFGKFMMQKAV